MKHFDYSAMYKNIRNMQKEELKEALKRFPNHEFHFGEDYESEEQYISSYNPYIIGYIGEVPVSLKVIAVKEDDGYLSVIVRDEESDYECAFKDVDLDIALGHLENILDALPE